MLEFAIITGTIQEIEKRKMITKTEQNREIHNENQNSTKEDTNHFRKMKIRIKNAKQLRVSSERHSRAPRREL
ncbi:hypothetical protein SESBI_42134 [Sesbania bispinosa]|nr:hypothetical protein SESBI_42134 [Sesbania bispinosa]